MMAWDHGDAAWWEYLLFPYVFPLGTIFATFFVISWVQHGFVDTLARMWG